MSSTAAYRKQVADEPQPETGLIVIHKAVSSLNYLARQ
jgi:hypothetical protein